MGFKKSYGLTFSEFRPKDDNNAIQLSSNDIYDILDCLIYKGVNSKDDDINLLPLYDKIQNMFVVNKVNLIQDTIKNKLRGKTNARHKKNR